MITIPTLVAAAAGPADSIWAGTIARGTATDASTATGTLPQRLLRPNDFTDVTSSALMELRGW